MRSSFAGQGMVTACGTGRDSGIDEGETPMTQKVVVERRGAVQVITLNRPEAKNALDYETAVGVAEAIDELESSPQLRVGVLTGAGGTFSAGMDLKAFLRGESPVVGDRGMCGITRAVPVKPLVGAVEGWAVAGGFELLLACDLIVAARDARLGVPEVTRALVAGGGAALLLPRRIPYHLALELLLTGETWTAERAAQAGLVNRVTDPGGALDAAVELATVIAANGPLAVAATKRIARECPQWPDSEMWDRQTEIMDPVFRSADAVEGATAFAQKRAPVWQGR